MDSRVTSPTWVPPPPCKQALRYLLSPKENMLYFHWARSFDRHNKNKWHKRLEIICLGNSSHHTISKSN